MVLNDERHECRRNVRNLELGQVSERAGNLFHDSNRDDRLETEVKRAEKSEVRDGERRTVARHERQLLHFNVVGNFQNVVDDARQRLSVEISKPETLSGTVAAEDFGKCFDNIRCIGPEPVPVDVEALQDPARFRFSSDDPVPGPASLSDTSEQRRRRKV